ncbi:MAG: hypothetical protein ACOVOV_16405 [Dolichospermum sp.]|jgi:hypothetical protein
MTLTDHEIGLLHEVYEITMRDTTAVSGGSDQSRLMPDLFSSGQSIRQRLQLSIDQINLFPAQVERVRVILAEFEELSLDPSKIDKDGYQLRPGNNLAAIRRRLYIYTGILFNSSTTQRLSIG